MKSRARLRLKSEGKLGQKHDMKDILEPPAKTRDRLEPRRGQTRESTQPFLDLKEKVENTTLTVFVVGTVGSVCFNESMDRHFEKLTDLVVTSTAFPGKPSGESVQVLVRTCLEVCAVDLAEVYLPALINKRSRTAWLVYRGGCRLGDGLEFGDQITPGTHTGSNEQPKRKTEGLHSKFFVPIVPDITESQRWELNSIGVERQEHRLNTITSHTCCA